MPPSQPPPSSSRGRSFRTYHYPSSRSRSLHTPRRAAHMCTRHPSEPDIQHAANKYYHGHAHDYGGRPNHTVRTVVLWHTTGIFTSESSVGCSPSLARGLCPPLTTDCSHPRYPWLQQAVAWVERTHGDWSSSDASVRQNGHPNIYSAKKRAVNHEVGKSLSDGHSRTSLSIVQRLPIRGRTQVENTVLLTGDSEALRNHSGQEPVLLHKRTLYHVRTGRHPPHTRGATAGGQKGPVRRRRSLASRFTKRDYVDACQCCRTIRYQGSDLQPRFRLYYVVRVYRSTVLKYFIFILIFSISFLVDYIDQPFFFPNYFITDQPYSSTSFPVSTLFHYCSTTTSINRIQAFHHRNQVFHGSGICFLLFSLNYADNQTHLIRRVIVN